MITAKMKFALGLVVVGGMVAGVVSIVSRGPLGTAQSDPVSAVDIAGHPAYLNLKAHVESLAAIDQLCKNKDSSTCYCELAERIRDEHDAIDRLLMDDPALRGFVISVRQPASGSLKYDLNKLPQVPDETKCLSTVAAPVLIDQEPEI